MKKSLISVSFTIGAVGLGVLLSAWIATPSRHIELTDSFPKADAVVDSVPIIQLWFSVPPELERSGVGIRGPDGTVRLSEIEQAEDSLAFKARVLSELTPGRYTVSWLAAPDGDHGVRGRFGFTVGASGLRGATGSITRQIRFRRRQTVGTSARHRAGTSPARSRAA